MGPTPHSSSRGAVSNRRSTNTGGTAPADGRTYSHGPSSSTHYQQYQQYHVQPQKTVVSIQVLLICLLSCLGSFYGGLILGMNASSGNGNGELTIGCNCQDTNGGTDASNVKGRKTSSSLLSGLTSVLTSSGNRFPPPMEKLFAGAARMNRDDFMKQFEIGVPVDATTAGNQEALILYHHPKSISNVSRQDIVRNNGVMPLLTVQDATINCDTLKIILTEPNRPRQCTAIVGQWESYHIHKYMRLPPDNVRTGIDGTLPLRAVARTHSPQKGKTQIIPKSYNVETYDQKILLPYLTQLPQTLARLKPIAKQIARDNTIVVLVCNFGQSELLVNFICNARAKGFDLSQVLVFTTDLETQKIVEAFGIATFYDDVIFERMPEQAAARYGDGKFTGMMMAKVFCVHLLTQLDYNVLFQDVDVVWYRNPVEYFLREIDDDFDIYFQDDGAHSVRYAPYSPNTGFYFVRAIDRTRYLFNCFVKLADTIQQSGSHQSALTSLLNEHVSYRGLRVKIFSRDTDDFPGGYHYHRGKAYMKKLLTKSEPPAVKPYIFHMSWTNNKMNKRKFFQQMGEWYVHPQCIEKKLDEMPTPIVESCCSLDKPLVECHYRDKPSIIPCTKKPPIDKAGKSWW